MKQKGFCASLHHVLKTLSKLELNALQLKNREQFATLEQMSEVFSKEMSRSVYHCKFMIEYKRKCSMNTCIHLHPPPEYCITEGGA